MAEKEYIERKRSLDALTTDFWEHYSGCHSSSDVDVFEAMRDTISEIPAADVVEVVRCKDCKWFVPKHILLPDGNTREYTQEEKELPLGVPGDVGINCGSRCMRYIEWEDNDIPVWVQENDFCSYGKRKEATP